MKVGILTYHKVSNFGANLQALSTVSFFKNRGDDVVVIDWYPKDLEAYYVRCVSDNQRKVHDEFVKNYLPLTRYCESSLDVKNIIKEENFDLVVVGSDAVFSYIPFLKRIHFSRKTIIGFSDVTSDHKLPNPFWGDWVTTETTAKIASVSASAQFFDIDKCLPWNKMQLRKLLRNFDIINVRDRWTQKVISTLTEKTVAITPDPVFGFNINVKEQVDASYIRDKYNLSGRYVVLSFCKKIYSQNWFEQLYEKLKHKGYEVVNLAMPEGCVEIPCDKRIDVPLPPMDWYAIIKNADGYIGQRMHPMIVAFNNLVPFFVFDHYVCKSGKDKLNSSKIFDLLERANLLSSYLNIKENEEIDAAKVVDVILTFDKIKVGEFVKGYQNKYINMMNKITELV